MRRGRFAIAILVGLWSLPGYGQDASTKPAATALSASGTVVGSWVPTSTDSPSVLEVERSLPLLEPFQSNAGPFRTASGSNIKVEMRGRIQTDAIMAAQSAESAAVIGNLQNGYGFRRARLGMQGTIGDASHWVSEIEVAGGTVRLRDMFVGLTAIPRVNDIRIGYFREPFSLEGATSSNFITFLERSPLNALDPTRNWGLAGYWWPESERMLFGLGVFRTDTSSGGQSIGDAPDWALTGRLTGLPVYEPNDSDFRLVHLGAAMSLRHPPNGVAVLNPNPQSDLLTVSDDPASPFLPTVAIPSNGVQLYNLQAASVAGPFSIQSEWFGMSVQQIGGGVVFGHGFYADASYFLTGEHRGYDLTRGAFDKVSVRNPVTKNNSLAGGAVELTIRYSYVNYNSPNLPLSSDGQPTGAILHQFTAGTNWYLNDYTRLMLNYTFGVTEASEKPTVAAHLFGLRAAIDW